MNVVSEILGGELWNDEVTADMKIVRNTLNWC